MTKQTYEHCQEQESPDEAIKSIRIYGNIALPFSLKSSAPAVVSFPASSPHCGAFGETCFATQCMEHFEVKATIFAKLYRLCIPTTNPSTSVSGGRVPDMLASLLGHLEDRDLPDLL